LTVTFGVHGPKNSYVWMTGGHIGKVHFCKLQDESQGLMRPAITQLQLSARGYHRVLRLARTIADLAGCEEIQSAVIVVWSNVERQSVQTRNIGHGRLAPEDPFANRLTINQN